MISRLIKNTSLTVKIALVAALSLFAACVTLVILNGSSSRALTREFIMERGVSEADLVASTLYGATRFGDEEAARTALDDALIASNTAGNAAVVVRPDGSTFVAAEVTPGAADALAATARDRILSGQPGPLAAGELILTPIHKPGTDHADPANLIGVLAFDWRADSALALAHRAEMKAIAAAIGVAVVALILVVLGVKYLVIRPLDAQRAQIGRLTDGDFGAPTTDFDRTDEIGAIGRSVETLRATLQEGEAVQRDASYKGAAFTAASAAMMVTDNDLRIRYVNPALVALMAKFRAHLPRAMNDISAQTLEGLSMEDFHTNGDHVRARLRHLGNEPMKITIAFGESRVLLSISRVQDPSGAQLGLILEWADVTEQWFSNAIIGGLESQQLRLDLAPSGRILAANDNLCAALEQPAGALIGTAFEGLVIATGTESEGVAASDAMARAQSHDVHSGRIVLQGRNGQVMTDGSLACVKDTTGRPIRFILLARDVTVAETALKEARDARRATQREQENVVEALRIGLRELSEGNLTAAIETPFPGSYEDLRTDFNRAMTTLGDAIRNVVDNADNIANEARDISGNTDGLSRRTEATAATLEQTAAALNDLTNSTRVSAQGAKEADSAVREAQRNAEQSGDVVVETVAAMDQIAESSGRITSIIKVIDDIAFQTNLLALNAGVEAARAGDAGRGFAVVASEVRALAQRSSDAAREINDLIDKSGTQVKHGVDLVGRTGQALQEIVSSVSRISGLVSSIAESSVQQSTSLNDINASLNQLDQSTQQNAARLEETTAASESLRKDAVALVETVAYFKLHGGTSAGQAADLAVVPFRARPRQTTGAAEQMRPVMQPEAAAAAGWEDF